MEWAKEHRTACHTRPCCVSDVAGYITSRASIRLIDILNLSFLFSFPSIAWPLFFFGLNSWIVVGMSWFKNIGSFLGWLHFYWSLLVYLGSMLGIDASLDYFESWCWLSSSFVLVNAAFKFYSCTLNYLLTIDQKKKKKQNRGKELTMVIQGSYPRLRSCIDEEYCCSAMLRSLIVKIIIN